MKKRFLRPAAIALSLATASLLCGANADAWTLKEAAQP